MNPSIRILAFFAALIAGGCGTEAIVNTLDNAQLQAQREAAFRQKAKDVFKGTVTDVTGVAFNAIESAMTDTGSTAPRFARLAETQTMDVEATETLADGATVKITGSVTMTRNVDTDTMEIVPALSIIFTNVKVTVTKDDGTTEEVLMSGSETIGGLMTVQLQSQSQQQYAPAVTASAEPTFTLSYDIRGRFTLDGTEVHFDIKLGYDGGETMTYSGTIDGEQVNESVDAS